MYKLFTRYFLWLFIFIAADSPYSFAQNSILVNLGSANCSTPTAPVFSLFGSPLTPAPSVLALCDLSNQLPDYFNTFIAYNPKDNKIYICDIRTGVSKVWVMDVGLPGNIACPPNIPDTPTYSYSYLPNNFEFDNNGNLWSFRNYNDTTGLCVMDRFDVTTGNVLFTKTLQFPLSNLPNTLGSGDLAILPNGRMFVVFGNFPSQLYEVTNYETGTSNATATYLQTMPNNTYGMAYLNGLLEITGTDEVSSCYYYTYDISNNILGSQQVFQNGQSPIDNTSVTPAIGATKQLIGATLVNSNTANLIYEVYVRNMGNVILNNINATDDLGAAFGAANVSNVTAVFETGNNTNGLTLNSNYNGTTDINLLNAGQNLPNQTSAAPNYYFKLLISCTVTNLSTKNIYYNSAIGNATIGSGAAVVDVADSSNNGPAAVVDPNNDGNPSEPGENVPTPFSFNALVPVHFISVNASLMNSTTAIIKWSVATPTVDADKFDIEYSADGITWSSLAQVDIVNPAQGSYQYQQQNIPAANIYYRIKEIDNNGYYTFSKVVVLDADKAGSSYAIFPNPADNYIEINASYGVNGNSTVELFDAVGRKLISNIIINATVKINTADLPNGTYLIRIKNNENSTAQKVLIVH